MGCWYPAPMLALSPLVAWGLMMVDQDPADRTFVAPGASIAKLAGDLQFTEGPCVLPDGTLVFSDIPASKLFRIVDAKLAVYRDPSRNANGNTLDPEGRLVTCEHGGRRVVRQEEDGTLTTLAESFEGKKLNSPNDVVVRKDGALFFTDPPYGIRPEQAELGFNGVFVLVKGELKLLDKSFDRPNGLALSVDEKTLYVADTAKSHIRRFSLAPDGTAIGGEVWAETPHPDGIRVDPKGRVWSASGNGVNVISAEGKLLEVIAFPEQPANLCFDREFRTLYVTARKGVYSVAVTLD
jgi:sugar lactone lactonase YvrE